MKTERESKFYGSSSVSVSFKASNFVWVHCIVKKSVEMDRIDAVVVISSCSCTQVFRKLLHTGGRVAVFFWGRRAPYICRYYLLDKFR